MAKVVKNTLGYLGVDFQYRLVNSFFERPNFFKDMYSIIDQNMFTDTYLKTIIGIMKDYFEKHESVLSYDMLAIKINERAYGDDENQFYQETIEKLKETSTEGIDEVEEMAEKFFKQQNWVRVANQIIKIAGYGDMTKYDDCQRLMEEAMAVGRRTDDEVSTPFDSIEDDMSEESVVSIPTGISKLDSSLQGGLDKGKIGVIIGSSGFGKTSMTTGLGAYAATYRCDANNNQGFKVLQIVFEDTHRDIHRKYFGRFTQIETCKLNESPETAKMAIELLNNFPDRDLVKNNIKIVRYPTGEKTATDIKNEIKKRTNEGFKPDLVIIDYFECLQYEKADSEWNAEGKTMRKLSAFAEELDVAMWIPTQGGRSSFASELVTLDQGGGSIKKQQIAQVVLSITRSVEDQHNNKATLALLKNRSGSAGIVLNGVKFNNGTCTISCDDVVEFDDALGYNEYANEKEEEIRKNLVRTIKEQLNKN